MVDVDNTSVSMLPTKVEIKMKKAEPGSWSKLDFPRQVTETCEKPSVQDNITERVDAVDLSDL